MTRLLIPASAFMLATLAMACSDDQATVLPTAPTGLSGAATSRDDSRGPGVMPGGSGMQSPAGLPGAVTSPGPDMGPDVMPAVSPAGSPAGRPGAGTSWGAVRVPAELLVRGGMRSPAGRPDAMPPTGGIRWPASLPDAMSPRGSTTPAGMDLTPSIRNLNPTTGYNDRNAYDLEMEPGDGEILITLIEDEMSSMREASKPHRMRRIEVGHCPVEPHHVGMTCGTPILSVVRQLAGRLTLTAPLAACEGWIVVHVDELSDDRTRGWRNAPCSGVFPDYPLDPFVDRFKFTGEAASCISTEGVTVNLRENPPLYWLVYGWHMRSICSRAVEVHNIKLTHADGTVFERPTAWGSFLLGTHFNLGLMYLSDYSLDDFAPLRPAAVFGWDTGALTVSGTATFIDNME